jgi:hypothetical protein
MIQRTFRGTPVNSATLRTSARAQPGSKAAESAAAERRIGDKPRKGGVLARGDRGSSAMRRN